MLYINSEGSMNFRFVNIKSLTTTLAVVTTLSVTANAAGTRYKDRLFDVTTKKDVTYASDVPNLSSLHTLAQLAISAGQPIYFYANETSVTEKPMTLDLYTPKGDSEKKRAAVIVAHGGAMVAGAKDDMDQHSVTYCDSLAARGFVTASIEYRLGVSISGPLTNMVVDSMDFARSVYRGTQDINAAVRYMRKNADELGIDPNKIYLLGNSSGAILSIENIYASEEKDFPTYLNRDGIPDLGTLNLYGEQGVDHHANAGVFLWGAIHDPKIIGKNKTPVFLAHGSDDGTVLFKTGRPLKNAAALIKHLVPADFSPALAAMNLDIQTPTLYGSFVIDSILKANDIAHETHFLEGAGHEFYDEDDLEEPLRTKIFDFLYNLASSDGSTAIKHVTLARSSGIQMQNGNMSFTVMNGNGLKYIVTDLRGRPAKTGTVSVGESVDLSSLSSGVYVLQVQGERAIRFGLSK